MPAPRGSQEEKLLQSFYVLTSIIFAARVAVTQPIPHRRVRAYTAARSVIEGARVVYYDPLALRCNRLTNALVTALNRSRAESPRGATIAKLAGLRAM